MNRKEAKEIADSVVVVKSASEIKRFFTNPFLGGVAEANLSHVGWYTFINQPTGERFFVEVA